MSNACNNNANVRNLEFTGGTLENVYNSSNSYCLRASIAANETIYVLSKDRYDVLKAGGSPSSKCNSNTWIIVSISFIILTILLIIALVILLFLFRKKNNKK